MSTHDRMCLAVTLGPPDMPAFCDCERVEEIRTDERSWTRPSTFGAPVRVGVVWVALFVACAAFWAAVVAALLDAPQVVWVAVAVVVAALWTVVGVSWVEARADQEWENSRG